nr:protein brambleberry-like isoform X2 [Cherax quadricarinatus]
MRYLDILLLLYMVSSCHGGLFSWLFRSKKNKEPPVTTNTADTQETGIVTDVSAKIPFEIKSSDEKFLMEAAAYTSLKMSELDVCHHKVIIGLQTTCADLTEEDLSRVAVNLLNCQSVAEGRPIYICTNDMTLSDCTKDMDPNTWNAYHIISNRARAVCYASRQELFGAKTQMAVNMLMLTAEEQIKTMDVLQEGQEALERATSKTLDSLSEGHEHLRLQQQQLSTAHHAIHNFVSSNLRELSREKKLIASGQRELAHITEAIKRKLEEAQKQLMVQESSQRDAHSIILKDLSKIQDNALEVWQKLDASTQKILSAHEETVQQYGRLTQDLRQMNETVHHLMDVLQSTKRGVEDKLSWISSLVGGTDNTIQKVYSCVLHAAYFFLAMLAYSFLQVPFMTRMALVVLVPLNAFAEVKHDTSLPFSTLTTILAVCVLVNLSLTFLWGVYQWQRKRKTIANFGVPPPLTYQLSSTPSEIQQLLLTEKVETTSPAKEHTITSSRRMSDIKEDSFSDYSCDDEPMLPPPVPTLTRSFMRRRILREATEQSSSPNNSSDCEVEENKVTNLQNSNSDDASQCESAGKMLSGVRRHLLDHLNSTVPSVLHHNLSLDSRNLISSSPLKETENSRSDKTSRSMTPRSLCAALCKNGQMCRNFVSGDSVYCFRHEKSSRESTPFHYRTSRDSTPLRNRGSLDCSPRSNRGSRDSTPLRNRKSRESISVLNE